MVSAKQLELEKYIARAVRPTLPENVALSPTPASLPQEIYARERYKHVMENFQKFKKETGPFLYYRIKEGYGTEIPSVQSRVLLPAVADMERELLRLGATVDVREDAPLAFALEYVARVRDELAPLLKGLSGADIYFSRQDRAFVGDEFYLHDPELKRWSSMLRRGQALAQAEKLPQGLRVAVLNDRRSVLEEMTKSHRNGVFIRNGELACFSSAADLIASVRSGKKYDIILTDIIVPGGGGYYLTNILRLDGFSGAIIALSAYERDDAMGLEMFERGFDGMLNLPISFEHSPFWASDVMRGLNKYLYLRRLNGWSR
uniref:Response regulatory domain-containing protein n=1 Tax=uncultured Elusimicrobia bacterium TaxID=699876 RepID=A0A650ENQ5_9BACT|nr:hypothetical protein Elusimicrob2101_1010 [uncultured Elusimicrobia bacterium]